MASTILVTGASGNVGREVVCALQSLDQPIRAAVPDEENARLVPGEGIDTVLLDFYHPDTYPAALDGVGRVFLMRPPAIADIERTLAPFIDAAQAAGVEHVVFLSLMGVNPRVPHHRVEHKLKHSHIPHTLLRPSYYMQNLNTTHAADIRDRDEVFIPAGRGKISFIDVRDIGEVAAGIFTGHGHVNQAYTLTGSQALSFAEVADIFSEVLGRPIVYANPSPDQFARRMRANGLPEELITVMLGLYATVRLGLGAKVTRDAQKLLGRPPIPFRQYVEDYAGHWQQTGI
jgi:uncharacterized protein YbjT (DUF2867 family)